MKSMFQSTVEFHKAFELPIGSKPAFPSGHERKLRRDLLSEEFLEYIKGEDNNDLENVAKELADIIYIVCGTAVSYGIPLDKVFEEVHISNMSKLVEGQALRREDGKVLKGPNYKEPNIKQFIEG